MSKYDKNLLEQLRLVVLTPEKDQPDETSMVLAMTANENIRQLGGALFCERRYDTVFTFHNGAESYYSVRGWRGFILV